MNVRKCDLLLLKRPTWMTIGSTSAATEAAKDSAATATDVTFKPNIFAPFPQRQGQDR